MTADRRAEGLADSELRFAMRVLFWLSIARRVLWTMLLLAWVVYAFARALNGEPPTPV
jgi:hypothetical protein